MGIAGAAKACGGVDLAAVVVAPAIFPLLGGASLSATVACCCSSMLLSAKAPVVLDVVGAVVGLAADVAIPCCCCCIHRTSVDKGDEIAQPIMPHWMTQIM